jgi:ABC-2 type transport system ATP-binding protein
VIILMNGEIKADARLVDLEASSEVILILQTSVPEADNALRSLPGVLSTEPLSTTDGPGYRIQAVDKVDLRPAVYDLARDQGWPVKELRRDVRTLEAVFSELATAAQDRASPAPSEDRPGEEAPDGEAGDQAKRSLTNDGGES